MCFQDLLFNENGEGWLAAKMRKRREAIRKQRNKENVHHNAENQTEQIEYTEADAANDFELLKSTMVDDSSIELIKEKLILTQNYRAQILLDMRSDIRESFPYFFVRSDLVSSFSIDFNLMDSKNTVVICFSRFYLILNETKNMKQLKMMHWRMYGEYGCQSFALNVNWTTQILLQFGLKKLRMFFCCFFSSRACHQKWFSVPQLENFYNFTRYTKITFLL